MYVYLIFFSIFLQEGVIEKGVYGEWRKVVPVEEFYDVLLDAHVRIQGHGGYKNLLRAVFFVCIFQKPSLP